MSTYLPLTILVAGLIIVVAATVSMIIEPRSRGRKTVARVRHRHNNPGRERVPDDTAEIERLSMDKLRGLDHLTHAWGQIPRVMPAGRPPWPIMPAGPDHMIQYLPAPVLELRQTVTDAEVEQVRAELAAALNPPRIAPDVPANQGGCGVCGDGTHKTEGHDAVFSIIAPPGEPDSPPSACRCGRPAGHLGDALAHGTPDDIDSALSTGTFEAVRDA